MPLTVLTEIKGIWRTLLGLGATPAQAKSLLVEVYSPPRVTSKAAQFPKYGVLPGGAFDLRPGPDGQSWDFDLAADRREARARIDRIRPYVLIGSHPCTDFCMVQHLNRHRWSPAEVRRRHAEAMVLLGFAV